MTVGGCRTGCGSGSSRCCPIRRCTRWVATTRGRLIATRWTRSCWYSDGHAVEPAGDDARLQSDRSSDPTEESPQGLCLDPGYDFDIVRRLAAGQRFQPHIRTRGDELAEKLRDPSWRARRWVGEACNSWLNR